MTTRPAPLTDNTGVTPDRTIANVPAATAATTDTSAASLTSTNAAITALENGLSDLADFVNDYIATAATGATFAPTADRTAGDPNTNGS